MPGTDYRNGSPLGSTPMQYQSRSAEFSSGISGVGGSTYSVQQNAPTGYMPSSVLSPIGGNTNGQSPSTFNANRTLSYYRGA